jgi:hypothetical protein
MPSKNTNKDCVNMFHYCFRLSEKLLKYLVEDLYVTNLEDLNIIFGDDGSLEAIRKDMGFVEQKCLIEAGKNSIFFSAAFSKPEPRKKNFRELTAAALGHEPDRAIITYVIVNFAVEMLAIENHESIQAAEELYRKAQNRPKTETQGFIKSCGYTIQGPYLRHSNLSYCFTASLAPRLLKLIHRDNGDGEYFRMKSLVQKKIDFNHENIMKIYEIIEIEGGKLCIISEIYPVSLDNITSLFDAPRHFEIFYNHMCRALEHLHRQHHVFVDLKPSNICIDTSGKFILIDIGSIVEKDSTDIYTSNYFLPVDAMFTSGAEMDFYMLGFTMLYLAMEQNEYETFVRQA